MRAWLLLLGSLVPLALASPGCSSSSDGPAGGAGSGGGGMSGPMVVPQCSYTIAPRAEYTSVFAPKSAEEARQGTTTADPHVRRIRLGLGGNVRPDAQNRPDPSTSAAIAWETDEGVTASWVEYGTSADPTTWEQRQFGVAYVVPKAEKALSAKNTPQQMHEVHLCGLTPSTTYYYRVGGGPAGSEFWSDVLSFRTTPAADSDEEVTIAVTGDSRGNHNNAWQILQERLYKRGDLNAQLFSGDIVDLAFDQEAYETWLDGASLDMTGKRATLGQVLTLISMGNHEFYNAQFFSSIVQPQDPSYDRKYDELFFSTNIGPVHLVVLDDERIGVPGADPAYAGLVTDWVKADLGAVDRQKQPWVAVVHHRSEYSSSNHGDDKDVLKVRAALTPIWDEHNVTLVLAGHDHNYERSKPMRQDKPGAEGTRYIVCAGSGAESYGNGTTDHTEISKRYDDTTTIGVYGILKASRSKLSFSARYLSTDGTDPEIDSFSLP